MGKTKVELDVGGIYLIRKVGVGSENIFIDKKDYSRFLLGLEFYNSKDNINLWRFFFCRQKKCKRRKHSVPRTEEDFFEEFKKNLWEKRLENSKKSQKARKIISLLGFTLLPRSYYLLVLEIEKNGISRFMHKMGGYSSYFNRRHNRKGVLFRSQYECWRIKDKEQAINILNMLHVRPIEKCIREEKFFCNEEKRLRKKELLNKLKEYRYSSFLDYIGRWNFASVTNRGFLLDYLRGKGNYKKYLEKYLEGRINVVE